MDNDEHQQAACEAKAPDSKITILPDSAWSAIPNLPNSALRVFLCLCKHWNKQMEIAFPTVDTIANQTGLKRRSVQLGLREAERSGLIRHEGAFVYRGVARGSYSIRDRATQCANRRNPLRDTAQPIAPPSATQCARTEESETEEKKTGKRNREHAIPDFSYRFSDSDSGHRGVQQAVLLKLCELFGVNPDRYPATDKTSPAVQGRSDFTCLQRIVRFAIRDPAQSEAKRQACELAKIAGEAKSSCGRGRPIAKFIQLAKGRYPGLFQK